MKNLYNGGGSVVSLNSKFVCFFGKPDNMERCEAPEKYDASNELKELCDSNTSDVLAARGFDFERVKDKAGLQAYLNVLVSSFGEETRSQIIGPLLKPEDTLKRIVTERDMVLEHLKSEGVITNYDCHWTANRLIADTAAGKSGEYVINVSTNIEFPHGSLEESLQLPLPSFSPKTDAEMALSGSTDLSLKKFASNKESLSKFNTDESERIRDEFFHGSGEVDPSSLGEVTDWLREQYDAGKFPEYEKAYSAFKSLYLPNLWEQLEEYGSDIYEDPDLDFLRDYLGIKV